MKLFNKEIITKERKSQFQCGICGKPIEMRLSRIDESYYGICSICELQYTLNPEKEANKYQVGCYKYVL